jgi:DNA-binding MarR family transcriptional regulator
MRSDAMQLGLLLRQSHRRAAAALDAAISPLGLAGRHFGVLLILDRDGSSTQRDLLAQIGTDKAGMARSVADLEAAGLVERETDATDRRVVHLRLTASGRERFREARGRAAQVGDDLVRGLDDEELARLVALLRRFVTTADG